MDNINIKEKKPLLNDAKEYISSVYLGSKRFIISNPHLLVV
jgi:hypothetical protein